MRLGGWAAHGCEWWLCDLGIGVGVGMAMCVDCGAGSVWWSLGACNTEVWVVAAASGSVVASPLMPMIAVAWLLSHMGIWAARVFSCMTLCRRAMLAEAGMGGAMDGRRSGRSLQNFTRAAAWILMAGIHIFVMTFLTNILN